MKRLIGWTLLVMVAVTIALWPLLDRGLKADTTGALDGTMAIGDASSLKQAEVDSSGNLAVSTGKGVAVVDMTAADGSTLEMLVTGTGATNTVYTRSVALGNGIDYALAYKVTGTSPQTVITMEQSWQAPAIEGDTDPQWGLIIAGVVPLPLNTLTSNTLGYVRLTPGNSGPEYMLRQIPYARFKIIGVGTNPAGPGTRPSARLRLLKTFHN